MLQLAIIPVIPIITIAEHSIHVFFVFRQAIVRRELETILLGLMIEGPNPLVCDVSPGHTTSIEVDHDDHEEGPCKPTTDDDQTVLTEEG